MIKRTRIAIASLALSAAALVNYIVSEEHYVREAKVPTKNDRCTNGFGGTFNEDGTPVKCGDVIEPVPALQRTLKHIQKDEAGLKRCVTAPLYQEEYDILLDFSYQYGVPTTCRSSMVLYTNAGRYEDACQAYTKYKFSGGYDCSTTINGKPNKRCWGVWTRNIGRMNQCLAAQ